MKHALITSSCVVDMPRCRFLRFALTSEQTHNFPLYGQICKMHAQGMSGACLGHVCGMYKSCMSFFCIPNTSGSPNFLCALFGRGVLVTGRVQNPCSCVAVVFRPEPSFFFFQIPWWKISATQAFCGRDSVKAHNVATFFQVRAK